MPFFNNKRKDFSIQPPKQEVSSLPFFVTDSSNIDFTLLNNNLTADLTLTGVIAGTYGDATNIPVLQIDQWGRVTGVTTITIGGGGGTYTVDNGLTENIPNNFQLGAPIVGGAPLLHDTYIDTLTDKTLFLEGQKTSLLEYILNVTNAANDGNAILASALGLGTALRATSVSASAVSANSTNAPAIAASTGGSNEAGLFTNSDAGTNNIVQGIRLRHSSSGVPASGFGIAAEFSGKTTLNSDLRLGRLIFQWTDTVTASRTSKFQVETVNSASASVKVEVAGNGEITLNSYGQTPANFPGTPTYALGVDSSGNVVEFTPSGGGSQLNETTGILFGGQLSAAIGGTTFSVTAGIGQIVTQTASISGVVTTVNNVTWSAVSGAAITNIGTSQFTYVLVNNAGTVIQQTTPFTDAQYKTHIIIGILCHIDFASVNLVTNAQNVAYEDPHRLVELISAFGPIKKTGLNISANGPNLRVNRTSGEAFKIGSNYTTDQFEPDVVTIPPQTPAKLCRVHRDGSGGFIFDTFGGVYYDDIDPNQYDDGSGTLAPVPSNRWTIQRLFFFPNNPNDIICYYGIQLYNNFSEARAGVEFEIFDEATITAENAVFLGFLFVRHNATDLTDPNFAAFLQSGLFRGIPPGGGGSGGGGGILTDDSIQGDGTLGNEVKLVNDAAIPGVNKVYGTDNAGNRGWRNELVYPAGVIPGTVVGTFPAKNNSVTHLVVGSADRLYVPSFALNIVDVYEASSGDYLGTLSITNAYSCIYVTSLNEVWVSSPSSTMTRLNPSTFAVLGTFTGATNVLSYAEVSSTKIYLATVGNTIVEVNPSSLTVTATITAASLGVTSIRYITYVNNPLSLHHQYLAGVCPTQSEFYAINTTTNGVVIAGTNFGGTLGSPPTGIAYNSVEDNYYISFAQNQQVRIFKPTSPTVATFQNRKQAPFCNNLVFDPVTQKVYTNCIQAQNGLGNANLYVQCIDENNLYWTTLTPSVNIEASFSRTYISLDSVNGYVYIAGTTLLTGVIDISKVKI